jgi:HD-GYP domain-containing protein (c-di-GMP phosphodiesterase class II)
MTSDRSYRRALPVEQALAELRAGSGSQFDPRVVDALLASL